MALAREEWNPVVNLDVYFANVYAYFRGRGFKAILVSSVCEVVMLLVVFAVTIATLRYVNWDGISHACIDKASCAQVPVLVARGWSAFAALYACVLGTYVLASIVGTVGFLLDMLEIRDAFTHGMATPEAVFEHKSWENIVELLVQHNRVSRVSQFEVPEDYEKDRSYIMKDATFGMHFYH